MKDLLEAVLSPDDVSLAKRSLAGPIFGEKVQELQEYKAARDQKAFSRLQ